MPRYIKIIGRERRQDEDAYIGEGGPVSKRDVPNWLGSRSRVGGGAYNVSGRVLPGESRVVVSGRKPITNRKCQTAYRQDVRLVFDRR